MQLEQFNDVEEALKYVHQQGYVHRFMSNKEGWQCQETKKVYAPEELLLVTCHRFQKCGGAHKVEVLYVVSAPDGTKGIILDNCSTYGNVLFGDYLLRMKLHNMHLNEQKKAC